MSEVQPSVQPYLLGQTPEAHQRLLVQGRMVNVFWTRIGEKDWN